MGAEIFEAWLHRGENDAGAAKTFGLDELHKGRDARLVVAIDASCPFEFDEG